MFGLSQPAFFDKFQEVSSLIGLIQCDTLYNKSRMFISYGDDVKSAEIVIVGGGMVGLSIAYQLARRGVQTRLFQAGDLGGGTSSANAGRAQVCEGPLDDLNLQIIRQGLKRFDTLEEELGTQFEWHRLGYLCLINTEELWQIWKKRAQILTDNGIPTELLDRTALSKAEPNLNITGYLGAAYAVEGLVNPFLLCWAYSQAARRLGVRLHTHCPVTDFEIRDQRITAVKAGGEWHPAETVVFTGGAWTGQLFGLLGIDFPMFFTHAEAFITEPLPPVINHTIGMADFYERIHGRQQAASIGVGPHLNGSLLVTEAVTKTKEIHKATICLGNSHTRPGINGFTSNPQKCTGSSGMGKPNSIYH